MKPIVKFLFLGLFFLAACQNEKTLNEEPDLVSENVNTPAQEIILTSSMDHFRVRNEPDLNAETVAMLSKGEQLEFLDIKTSGEFHEVTLRGFKFKDPWVKIKTSESVEGWVYGGGLSFNNDSHVAEVLMKSRATALFGEELAGKIFHYRKNINSAKSSVDFARAFNFGHSLREDLVNIMHDQIEVTDYEKLPDLSWLEIALPGYKTQLVAEGTMFHLFQDYKSFQKKARKTKGIEDDDFVDLCLNIYPVDSVEHFFSAWFIQTWDYGGHSELGKGVHNQLLEKMNLVLVNSNLFELRIEDYKNQIITDITNTQNTYWFPKDAILEEIDMILNAGYGILSDDDKIALQTRRKMFESPEDNGIEVNHRAGFHDS